MTTLDEYRQFIAVKKPVFGNHGITVDASQVNPLLKPFQRDIVVWAAKKGRAAVFADTGLGKTLISLEWARLTGQKTIIVAPLSVARQTVRMAGMVGLEVRYVRTPEQVTNDHLLWITNYEMIEKFDPAQFSAVVLDESSILKAIDGKTRRTLTEMFSRTPYRLCCTATPAPNDLVEIGNHAEFLGISTASEMKAMFFINANIDHYVEFAGVRVRRKGSNAGGQEWRLRHHGEEPFYKWMASWAMSVRRPSDLGYSDDGYILPPLTITPEWLEYTYTPDDRLAFTGFTGIKDFLAFLRKTIELRCNAAAERVNADNDQWIVWTYLEDESTLAHKLIPGSVEVKGSDSPEYKAEMIEAFQDGKFRVLVTKPDIAGFGMNFQNASKQYWVTVRYSWEEWYQAIRRSYRFLQDRPVQIYASLTPQMQDVWTIIQDKEKVAAHMSEQLIAHVRKFELEELGDVAPEKRTYTPSKVMRIPAWLTSTSTDGGAGMNVLDQVLGENFAAYHGDSGEVLKGLPSDSVDLSVYSPPFADLFVYSNSERDLGNSRTPAEFFAHYRYMIAEILRVTKPGRITCVHTADIPAMKERDGYMGMKDFPGAVIDAYEAEGWIYWGYAVVAKNPQAQAIRTKSHALLFKTLARDSASSRPAILDRVLFFKKPGENAVPVTPVENGEIDNEQWIYLAGGIWTDVSESDTLQYTTARDTNDEKHVCPLQLGTIKHCVKLYSNPGEIVLTPFMGIGSEAYTALKLGRKAIGIELKKTYFDVAVRNLRDIESQNHMPTLFDMMADAEQMELAA